MVKKGNSNNGKKVCDTKEVSPAVQDPSPSGPLNSIQLPLASPSRKSWIYMHTGVFINGSLQTFSDFSLCTI